MIPPQDTDFDVCALHFPLLILKLRRDLVMFSNAGINSSSSMEGKLLELRPDKLKKWNDQIPEKTKSSKGKFTTTGNVSVTVQAGNFQATKFSLSEKYPENNTPVPLSGGGDATRSIDVWGSPKIPILGIVKRTEINHGKDNAIYKLQTELVSYSESGAVDKITDMPPDSWITSDATPIPTQAVP